MIGSIYLIGGGEIRKGETVEIDNELKEICPANSTFVFFGTAAGDSPEYIHTIESIFKSNFKIIAPTEKDGPEFALSAIKSASIIYLGGGTTKLLLDLFEKWELVQPLREALNRDVHLVGMSAGALALSTWYLHEEGDSMELRRGWGFASVCTLVHAQKDSSARAQIIWKGNKDAHATPLIAIGEGAAWRISSHDTQKVGSGEIKYIQH